LPLLSMPRKIPDQAVHRGAEDAMLSFAILLPVIFLLSMCSVGGLLVAAFYPRLSAGADLRRRSDRIAPTRTAATTPLNSIGENRRKRSVEETLRDAEDKLKFRSKEHSKPSLLTRMNQGNVGWSRRT
jgi:tight adherence protein B